MVEVTNEEIHEDVKSLKLKKKNTDKSIILEFFTQKLWYYVSINVIKTKKKSFLFLFLVMDLFLLHPILPKLY